MEKDRTSGEIKHLTPEKLAVELDGMFTLFKKRLFGPSADGLVLVGLRSTDGDNNILLGNYARDVAFNYSRRSNRLYLNIGTRLGGIYISEELTFNPRPPTEHSQTITYLKTLLLPDGFSSQVPHFNNYPAIIEGSNLINKLPDHTRIKFKIDPQF